MNRLQLSLACGDYDRTRALTDGRVRPEGIDLTYLALPPDETFFRMLRYQEFDVSELSLSAYTIMKAHGQCPFVAIPVFPSRCFRHSAIFIRTDVGIREPKDLIGRRVGVPDYQMTAAVWARGALQHEYGVSPESIHWVLGGQEQAGRGTMVRVDLPAKLKVERLGPGETLNGMMEAGKIDALISPVLPTAFRRHAPWVARLFPNYREVEEDYFRRTGIFPIMHTVVIKEALYQQYPWVAQSLYKAFEQAKQLCYDRFAYEPLAHLITMAWATDELERERALMGEDFWPYGFEANRQTVATLCQYVHEQGLAPRAPTPEELFAPNTLASYKR